MIYKLYIMTFKEKYKQDPSENEFKELYRSHGVKNVGEWIDVDNPNVGYFINAYEDTDHYKNFVEAMKDNETYKRLNTELAEMRESIKVVNMVDRIDFLQDD